MAQPAIRKTSGSDSSGKRPAQARAFSFARGDMVDECSKYSMTSVRRNGLSKRNRSSTQGLSLHTRLGRRATGIPDLDGMIPAA